MRKPHEQFTAESVCHWLKAHTVELVQDTASELYAKHI